MTHSKVCCADFLPNVSLKCALWFQKCARGLQVTHRLPPPPAMVQFLSGAQAERGIKDGVMHGVSHNAVGLWVETLETQQSNGSCVCVEGAERRSGQRGLTVARVYKLGKVFDG